MVLHDVTHPMADYKGEDHNLASAKTAKKFLESIKFNEEKIPKIIHCIETYRTTEPPEPKTIEAKIVASADNLTHFTMFNHLSKEMGLEKATKKLQRDIISKFMIPEAIKKAKKIAIDLEKEYKIKI